MTQTVMIVDDLPVYRAKIRDLVTNAGFRCIEAANGQDAVDKYGEEQPDVVLMDLNLPIMNGIEALEEIRADYPDAKIAMLTAYNSRNTMELAKTHGAADYLAKTASNAAILQCVGSLLRRSTTSMFA